MRKKIKALVYDFDGVMTNNKVYINQDGDEIVQVSRADGLAISEIKKLGISQIIISTEKNLVVSARAQKLEIPCLQGIENKKVTLIDYCKTNDLDLHNILYVGNDINDEDAMNAVGTSVCPQDAHKDIKAISSFVLQAKGGEGVIRELYDLILETKGI